MSGRRRKSSKKDNRDWKKYNEELVVRGEFYLDFEFVKSWNEELKKMNKGKRGGQYKFPYSFMKLEAVWKKWIDYRGLEGIARSFTKLGLIPKRLFQHLAQDTQHDTRDSPSNSLRWRQTALDQRRTMLVSTGSSGTERKAKERSTS